MLSCLLAFYDHAESETPGTEFRLTTISKAFVDHHSAVKSEEKMKADFAEGTTGVYKQPV